MSPLAAAGRRGHMQAMARLLALLALLVALAGAAPWLLPVAKTSLRLVAAHDDPVTLADLGLAGFTAQEAETAMAAALAADEPDLAASYLELAQARGLAVAPQLKAQVEAANATPAQALRAARNFGTGFVTGQPEDVAGLAGTAVGDLLVWGDIRDASREGWKLARGEAADELILGLSAVGLAVTAGTYATAGASLPLRAGLTLVKGAARAGRLSAGLARSLVRAVRQSVDGAALRRLAQHPGSLDAAALKAVVRPAPLAGLARMLDDVATVEAKAGTRAALEGLKLADNGRDLGRLARLAEAKGGQTLAILKTLGRGALMVTGALLHLVWWTLALAFYAYAMVSSANGFCVACARRAWRRPRRGRARAPEPALAALEGAAPAGAHAGVPCGGV